MHTDESQSSGCVWCGMKLTSYLVLVALLCLYVAVLVVVTLGDKLSLYSITLLGCSTQRVLVTPSSPTSDQSSASVSIADQRTNTTGAKKIVIIAYPRLVLVKWCSKMHILCR